MQVAEALHTPRLYIELFPAAAQSSKEIAPSQITFLHRHSVELLLWEYFAGKWHAFAAKKFLHRS
jgi:hypothetical protein